MPYVGRANVELNNNSILKSMANIKQILERFTDTESIDWKNSDEISRLLREYKQSFNVGKKTDIIHKIYDLDGYEIATALCDELHKETVNLKYLLGEEYTVVEIQEPGFFTTQFRKITKSIFNLIF